MSMFTTSVVLENFGGARHESIKCLVLASIFYMLVCGTLFSFGRFCMVYYPRRRLLTNQVLQTIPSNWS